MYYGCTAGVLLIKVTIKPKADVDTVVFLVVVDNYSPFCVRQTKKMYCYTVILQLLYPPEHVPTTIQALINSIQTLDLRFQPEPIN